MENNLTVEQNDPRLCVNGTENLFSVVKVIPSEDGGSVTVTRAENCERVDADLFATSPDLLTVAIWAEAAFSHLARQGGISSKDRAEFQKRYEFTRMVRLRAEGKTADGPTSKPAVPA